MSHSVTILSQDLDAPHISQTPWKIEDSPRGEEYATYFCVFSLILRFSIEIRQNIVFYMNSGFLRFFVRIFAIV